MKTPNPKYAIIKSAGIQLKVQEGDEIEVFRLPQKEDSKINFPAVLLIKEDDKILIGQPFIKNAKVEATIIKNLRGEKIRVATYKAKSRYRRVKGHRDELTRIKIDKIVIPKGTKT